MTRSRGALRRSTREKGDSPILFFRNFLARPKEVASVIPSSRFLERRMAQIADPSRARVLVELGPGTGGTTRALLRSMHPDARLLAIEINRQLAERVQRRLHDPRLIVHHGSALEIDTALGSHGLPAADVVISGIPFSTLLPDEGRAILRAVHGALAPGGRFVAYQVRNRVARLGRELFGPPRVEREVRNVPPMRIYCFQKLDSPTGG